MPICSKRVEIKICSTGNPDCCFSCSRFPLITLICNRNKLNIIFVREYNFLMKIIAYTEIIPGQMHNTLSSIIAKKVKQAQ